MPGNSVCASSALCNSLSVNVTIYVAVYGLTCINDTYEDVKDDDASYSGLTLSRMRNKWDKAEEAKSPFTHRFQPKEVELLLNLLKRIFRAVNRKSMPWKRDIDFL